ncbi:MAG: oxidoreductase, partial [Gammaproteobacteria bacterium]|nr:oxidoreductase [Gammaproteobacteria bacterium]
MDSSIRWNDERKMALPSKFRAFRIHNDGATGHRSGIESVSLADLTPGEIVIKTAYSSVNFK